MRGIGEYLRLTDEELARIQADPAWAWDRMEDVREGEEHVEPGPSEALYHATDRAWRLFGVLLRRAGFPVDVSRGEQRVRYPDPTDGDYGCLTAGQVDAARLCPSGAEDDEALEALEGARGLYEGLVESFGAAARDGHAVLVRQPDPRAPSPPRARRTPSAFRRCRRPGSATCGSGTPPRTARP